MLNAMWRSHRRLLEVMDKEDEEYERDRQWFAAGGRGERTAGIVTGRVVARQSNKPAKVQSPKPEKYGRLLGQRPLTTGRIKHAAVNDPRTRKRNMLWSGALHSACAMWGSMAELTAAARNVVADEGDGDVGGNTPLSATPHSLRTLEPADLVQHIMDMLTCPLAEARQCGLGMLFSMPTTSPQLADLLSHVDVIPAVVRLLRNPTSNDFMHMSGVGAIGVLAAMNHASLPRQLWELDAPGMISMIVHRHLSVCYTRTYPVC